MHLLFFQNTLINIAMPYIALTSPALFIADTVGNCCRTPISSSSEDIVTSIPRILKPLAIALEPLLSSAIADLAGCVTQRIFYFLM
jgi:hypothetical protein